MCLIITYIDDIYSGKSLKECKHKYDLKHKYFYTFYILQIQFSKSLINDDALSQVFLKCKSNATNTVYYMFLSNKEFPQIYSNFLFPSGNYIYELENTVCYL